MKKEKRYLVPGDYMADPAVHVFNDRLYIYPSHDWESGIPENDNGGATKVDGTTVTWQNAVDAMNNALNGSGWQYELTGALPTLKKQ